MKKKIPVILGVIGTVLLAWFLANTYKAHRLYDNNVNTANYTALPVLTEGQFLSQTFTAKEDTIDAIGLKANLNGNYSAAQVTVTLKDTSTGEVLAQMTESAADIRPRKVHDFFLGPVADCKDRTLTLEVTQTGSTPSDGAVFYFQGGAGDKERLLVSGTEYDAVLVMRTQTYRFDVERFISVLLAVWFIWIFMWALYRLFSSK